MIAGTFLEHVCHSVGCPDRHSRRAGPGWCPRSIDERSNGLLSLGLAAARGYWLLPRRADSHRQEMLCCSPS